MRFFFLLIILCFSQNTVFSADKRTIRSCVEFLIKSFPGENDNIQNITEEVLEYENDSYLKREQSKSLKANLEMHGYDCGNLAGYPCLKKLSAENKNRILEEFDLSKSLKDKDLSFLYNTAKTYFRLSFVHNSHALHIKTLIPVISSKRLEMLGLKPGMNSGHFNETIMGGNDNVYFFPYVEFSKNPKNLKNVKTEYGSKAASPDPAYARERGWISPFVMYEDELSMFAFLAFDKHLKRSEGIYSFNLESELIRARKLLHQYDFTVDDYSELFLTLGVRHLERIKATDPKVFQKITQSAKKIIETGRISSKNAFIIALHKGQNYFLHRNHRTELSSFSFEFKIPAAIPSNKIIIY